MSYYQIKNGQAQVVQSPANVSGYDLILAQMPVSERQALGIFSKMVYSAEATEATADPILDTIFAPLQPEPPKQPLRLDRFKLIEALDKRGLLPAIDAYMSQDAKARWYFTTATVIEEEHPLLVQAISTLKQATGMTDEQVADIYNEARI